MRTTIYTAVFAALFLLGASGTALAQEQEHEGDVQDIDVFYNALSPYGDWVYTEEYGYVWKPVGVATDWQPYSYGRWVWTEEGWYWASYYEWGWAPFHYGRWAVYGSDGWVWVPGTVWAPAWVAWRYSDAYVGWYPLWPEFVVAVGVWYEYPYWHHHDHWRFVDHHHFGTHDQARSYVPPDKAGQAYAGTKETHEYTGHGTSTRLAGPPREQVEKASGTKIPQTRLTEAARPVHVSPYTKEGGAMQVYRPSFSQKAQVFLPPSAAAKVPETARPSVGQFHPAPKVSPGARPYAGKTPGQLGQPNPKYNAPLGAGSRPQGYGKPAYKQSGNAPYTPKQYPRGEYRAPAAAPGVRHAPVDTDGDSSSYTPAKPKMKGKEKKGP